MNQEQFHTKTVNDMTETLAFCEGLLSIADSYTYRPNSGLVAWRNTALHQLMHNRSHQMEY